MTLASHVTITLVKSLPFRLQSCVLSYCDIISNVYMIPFKIDQDWCIIHFQFIVMGRGPVGHSLAPSAYPLNRCTILLSTCLLTRCLCLPPRRIASSTHWSTTASSSARSPTTTLTDSEDTCESSARLQWPGGCTERFFSSALKLTLRDSSAAHEKSFGAAAVCWLAKSLTTSNYDS